MKDSIERISGNAFKIILEPESVEEKQVGPDKIGQYYHQALHKHLGEHIKPASITPDTKNSYCATVELMTESGPV